MSQINGVGAGSTNIQFWKQNGGALPTWLRPSVLGGIEANGTFLIATPLLATSGFIVATSW